MFLLHSPLTNTQVCYWTLGLRQLAWRIMASPVSCELDLVHFVNLRQAPGHTAKELASFPHLTAYVWSTLCSSATESWGSRSSHFPSSSELVGEADTATCSALVGTPQSPYQGLQRGEQSLK